VLLKKVVLDTIKLMVVCGTVVLTCTIDDCNSERERAKCYIENERERERERAQEEFQRERERESS
jgi:hypothetical protein